MCVSVEPAEFTGTTLYAGRVDHAVHGKIHVVGYQNHARNLADGPNAMLLHFPAQYMSSEHFLDTSCCPTLLDDMVAAVRDRPEALSWGEPKGVEVFEHDIYTVVLARDATEIPDAISQVPRHRRIRLNPAIFDFYAVNYPDYPVALCCFENRDAARSTPLLIWYKSLDDGVLALPAVDAHTGEPPDLAVSVAVDHWVIIGTDGAGHPHDASVHFEEPVPDALSAFLPQRVVGCYCGGDLPNGDFLARQTSDGIAIFRASPCAESPVGMATASAMGPWREPRRPIRGRSRSDSWRSSARRALERLFVR